MVERKSLLDNFKSDEVVDNKPSAEVVPIAPKAKPKAKTVQNTIYLPPQAHRQLKEIAFAMDCKVHDLFIQGIDHVLNSKGYKSVAELAKK